MPAPLLGRPTPGQLLREAPLFASSGCWRRRAVAGLRWSMGRSPAEGTGHLPHHSRGPVAGETAWPHLCTRRPTHIPRREQSQVYTRTPRRGWLHTQAHTQMRAHTHSQMGAPIEGVYTHTQMGLAAHTGPSTQACCKWVCVGVDACSHTPRPVPVSRVQCSQTREHRL